MTSTFPRACAAALLAFAAAAAWAADGGGGNDALAPAREHIASKRWEEALVSLREVSDPGNPDWHNLMGYSLRKAKTPDLAGSEKYYDQALRIDPKHLGTLEYSGELYLMKGELPTRAWIDSQAGCMASNVTSKAGGSKQN